jgi:hypothetical protein
LASISRKRNAKPIRNDTPPAASFPSHGIFSTGV